MLRSPPTGRCIAERAASSLIAGESRPVGVVWLALPALWRRLPVDHRTENGPFPFGEVVARGELGLAAGFDVDRDQGLPLFDGDEGGDALAVGGEDRAGLRLVGQLAQLAGFGAADLLRPEALLAAKDQHPADGRDVFDVGGADAGDLLFHFGAVAAHREDVGV